MALQLAATEPARIVVLPHRPDGREPVLNPSAAIDLALLGAVAQRDAPLDRLVEIVACLAGEGWSPAREVVLDRLQRATAAGWIAARENWVRSMPFVYGLAPEGAVHLVSLMRRPTPGRDDAEARAIASIKLALLDLLEPADAVAVNADLCRFYLRWRDCLSLRRAALPPNRPLIEDALTEQEALVERRLARLDALT